MWKPGLPISSGPRPEDPELIGSPVGDIPCTAKWWKIHMLGSAQTRKSAEGRDSFFVATDVPAMHSQTKATDPARTPRALYELPAPLDAAEPHITALGTRWYPMPAAFEPK